MHDRDGYTDHTLRGEFGGEVFPREGVHILCQTFRGSLMDKVKEILPEGGNLNLCLTCGACASGCPASGLEDMDPRKFLRMCAMGMDEEATGSNWVWMCTMCQGCIMSNNQQRPPARVG